LKKWKSFVNVREVIMVPTTAVGAAIQKATARTAVLSDA
jgi:hypothetical protein